MSPPLDGLRLYTVHGMVVGAILGSLAAAVYMAAYNYAKLGQPGLAKRIIQYGLALYGGILLLAFVLPQQTVWAVLLFLVLQGGLSWFFGNQLQGPSIRYHQQAGGQVQSMAKAVLVASLTALAMLFCFMIILAPLTLLTQSPTG